MTDISSTMDDSLIDVEQKGSINVIFDTEEMTIAEYLKEIERIEQSVQSIKNDHYSNNATLKRIQARTFMDILRARLYQLTLDLKMRE